MISKNLHTLSVIFLVLLCCLNNSPIAAQAPAIEWEINLGGSGYERAFDIKQTTDGGYIVVGQTLSNNGDVSGNQGGNDYWVVRLDGTGALIWQKTLGGSNGDFAESVQQTTDGGFIVAGRTLSNDGDVTGYQGSFDCWVVKLDPTGTLVWEKTFGGTGNDQANSIQQTSDGGYIVAGTSNSTDGDVTGNHGSMDYWVVKLDSTGTLIWEKSYGGTASDTPFSIELTTDGGYIVAGRSNSTDGDITGNIGGFDYWVIKLDSIGTLIWEKSYGGTASDVAFSIQQTTDGGYIVAGESSSNDGDVTGNQGSFDYWVIKLDSIGTLIWEKSFGGTGHDQAQSVQQTTDGGFVVAGYSSSSNGDISNNNGLVDFWVLKLDNTGNLLWEKSLGGTGMDHAFSIQQTTDGGYIVAGSSTTPDGDVSGNNGDYDFWIVKLHCDRPILPTLTDQQVCDYETPYTFDLSQSTQGVAAGLIVSYHLTQQDAEDNTNAIVDPENFEIPGGTQIIYVRINNGNCHVVGSFVIEVVTCPLPDAAIVIDVIPSLCYGQDTNMEVEYTIFNLGAADLPEQTPIAFYIDNDWVANDATEIIIPPGGQYKQFITLTLPETIPETIELKVLVNDDGQGIFVVQESDYTNNEDIVIYTFEQFPVAPLLPGMQLCNEGLNRAIFDFSELLDDLQLGSGEEIFFFETFDDAQANENRIYDFYSYLNITNPQTIYVRLENQFCFVITNFDISVKDCPPFIPQGFSPNGDQVNDLFEISNLLDVFPDHELHIYSRYGNLIFIGNNTTGFWDGISNHGLLNGQLAPVGVYYYILNLNHLDYTPYIGWVYLNR